MSITFGEVPPPKGSYIIPNSHLVELERLYVEEGLTLQQLGDRYGVTREAVRLRLPSGLSAIRLEKKAVRRTARAFLMRCHRALVDNRVCPVCGSWVLRGGETTVTCSSECAEAWPILRSVDDPDSHRRQMARTFLAKPGAYKPSAVVWAKKMLEDNPPPRNRHYFTPGSKRSAIARKYRPELFEDPS